MNIYRKNSENITDNKRPYLCLQEDSALELTFGIGFKFLNCVDELLLLRFLKKVEIRYEKCSLKLGVISDLIENFSKLTRTYCKNLFRFIF